jgi:uncharacterized protein
VTVTIDNRIERRALTVEIRADTAQRRLEGYAAVFNQDAPIAHFVERIAPGCFRSTLSAGDDVLCLVDHDPSALLGRTKSGTLSLSEDQRGLAFTVQLPDTQLARDTLALAQRGDIGGASIGFHIEKDSWPAADQRVLQAVKLIEISIVRAFPAYPQTSVQARALERFRRQNLLSPAQRRRWLETL